MPEAHDLHQHQHQHLYPSQHQLQGREYEDYGRQGGGALKSETGAKIVDEGLWVQCNKCQKWRRLPTIGGRELSAVSGFSPKRLGGRG